METLIDILKRGLDRDNHEIAPALVTGIALFGAALIINKFAPGQHDDRDAPPDYQRSA